MQKELISVIIPIYNVEEYLDRCIESVINQTYKDLEIILVDDGSPDSCPKKCDEWAKRDSRIVVIHKKNGGLSDARNAALDAMTGEYVFFVDGDDMIALNAIDIVVNVASESDSDMVVSKKYTAFSKDKSADMVSLDGVQNVNSNKALEIMLCETMRWEAWGTLYKRELFNDLRYPKGRIFEDIPVTPVAVIKSKSISFIDSLIYYYYIREDSIMRNNNTVIKMDLYYSVNDILKFFYEIKDKETKYNAISGILQELSSRVHFANKDKKNNYEFIRKSRELISKNIKSIVKSSKISMKSKIFIFLVQLNVSNLIWR